MTFFSPSPRPCVVCAPAFISIIYAPRVAFQISLLLGAMAAIVLMVPMGPKFAKQLISEYADIKNMGMPGFGEGGAAAEFLKHFIQPGVRFAHLDIAGVAWTHDHCPFNGKGITGFGVRLLMEWLMQKLS